MARILLQRQCGTYVAKPRDIYMYYARSYPGV